MFRSTLKKNIGGIGAAMLLLSILLTSSCGILPTQENPLNSLSATQTWLAFQLTQKAIEATLTAPAQAFPTNTPIPPPTVIAVAQPEATPVEMPVGPAEPSPQPAAPESEDDFETRIRDARILLYEDMVGVPKVRRYVKETLQNMGLPFEDTGSAIGRLKERLVFGGEGGAPYDLIIVAVENRGDPSFSGEYFEYLLANMEHGTSVIIEAWMLDRISQGKAKPLLDRCGVAITNYSGGLRNEMDMVLWPTGTASAVLTEPNNYPNLRKPIFFWRPDDLGDFMSLTGDGDAKLLVGRKADEPQKYGLVAVCLGGQLTLQTFSSHSYYIEPMNRVWENYIINALKARFQGPQE